MFIYIRRDCLDYKPISFELWTIMFTFFRGNSLEPFCKYIKVDGNVLIEGYPSTCTYMYICLGQHSKVDNYITEKLLYKYTL